MADENLTDDGTRQDDGLDSHPSYPVDAIVHSLKQHHLQPDRNHQPPTSSHPPPPPRTIAPPPVDPMNLDLTLTHMSPHDIPATAPPYTEPSVRSLRATTSATTISKRALQSNNARQDSNRLRRKFSTNFSDNSNTLTSQAKQDLVQGMVRSGAQCNVREPAVAAPTALAPDPACELSSGGFPLEVGNDGPDETLPSEPLSVESIMSQSRSGESQTLTRFGFPITYHRSKDYALRCQNLVRNKPRMRKRNKVHEKPSRPATPGVSGSTAASPFTTST